MRIGKPKKIRLSVTTRRTSMKQGAKENSQLLWQNAYRDGDMTKLKHKPVLMRCPECGSEKVTLREETLWMANTWEHYCYSIKHHDSDAQAECLDCHWLGIHERLNGYGET